MFGVVCFVITLSSLLIKDYSYINEQYIKQRKDSKIYYENSIKDELTGLYNRRFFNNKVKKIKEEYLLIFFDVDDFKKINDEYGHYIGDEVLKKIAKITENIVRESDIVCRYGGDEFIILLKNCPKNKAIDIANNLIRKINSDIIIDGQSYNITISAGLFRKNKDMDFEEVFKSTDNLLRKAKNNGKAKLEFK